MQSNNSKKSLEESQESFDSDESEEFATFAEFDMREYKRKIEEKGSNYHRNEANF